MPDALNPPVQIALNAAKDAIGAVAKKDRNTAQNFNFRGVDAVVNAAAPALNKSGIVVIPRVQSHVYEQVTTSAGKQAAHVILDVEYAFYGPLGDCLTARVVAEAMDYGDKAVAKGMSVAYRTALLQVLNLPTDEKDPDEDSFERAQQEGRGPVKPAREDKVPVTATAQKLLEMAAMATTADAVRKLYEVAATNGWLREEKAHPATGEKITVMDYLTARGSELKHKSGGGAAAGSVPGSSGDR